MYTDIDPHKMSWCPSYGLRVYSILQIDHNDLISSCINSLTGKSTGGCTGLLIHPPQGLDWKKKKIEIYFPPISKVGRSLWLSKSCINLFWLRRSVSSCSQTIPEALAKFWRAAGSEFKAFGYMVLKLRSIAFQRCIWRGGLPLVEMAENEIFSKKRPEK